MFRDAGGAGYLLIIQSLGSSAGRVLSGMQNTKNDYAVVGSQGPVNDVIKAKIGNWPAPQRMQTPVNWRPIQGRTQMRQFAELQQGLLRGVQKIIGAARISGRERGENAF